MATDKAECVCKGWTFADNFSLGHILVEGHHPKCPSRSTLLSSNELLGGLCQQVLQNRKAIEELKRKVTDLEEQLQWQKEHADQLDRNWSGMHDLAVDTIREAMEMPDATIPEMVHRIQQQRKM
jgi:hypothetical protein